MKINQNQQNSLILMMWMWEKIDKLWILFTQAWTLMLIKMRDTVQLSPLTRDLSYLKLKAKWLVIRKARQSVKSWEILIWNEAFILSIQILYYTFEKYKPRRMIHI